MYIASHWIGIFATEEGGVTGMFGDSLIKLKLYIKMLMLLIPALLRALQQRLLHPPFLVDLTRLIDRVFFLQFFKDTASDDESLQPVQFAP